MLSLKTWLNIKSVLPFHSLVTIQSTRVPTRSVLLQVTSLPTSISYLICLHSDTCNWLRKWCQRIVTPRPDWVDRMWWPIRHGSGRSDIDGGSSHYWWKRQWQMAYRRELWHIISGSEVRFMCNITLSSSVLPLHYCAYCTTPSSLLPFYSSSLYVIVVNLKSRWLCTLLSLPFQTLPHLLYFILQPL
jgi:hypothetical protein